MENSNITWTNHTFNLAWGCTKISPGCANCYADTLSHRYGFDVWGKGKTRRTFGAKHWAQPLEWNAKAKADGVRQRVFCSSMCDVFEDHPAIDAEREKLWPLIRQTPWLDWQLLTKRAERIAGNLPADWGKGYANVWLGVSVESGDYEWRFNEHLAHIPCHKHPATVSLAFCNWLVMNCILNPKGVSDLKLIPSFSTATGVPSSGHAL